MRRRSLGFTLVELLVGVTIGLIGMVTVFQVFAVWEGRKRTTSAGSDAQVAGSIAMFSLNRDVSVAGYGFGVSPYLGCTVNAYDSSRPTTNFTFGLRPVEIVDGAGGAPDSVYILYGNSATFVSSQTFSASTAFTKKTAGRTGLQRGDLAIVADAATVGCALVEITGDANADSLTIDHNVGAYTNASGSAATARFNAGTGAGAGWSSGAIYNLGPLPRRNLWQIRTGNRLGMSDELHYTDANADGANDWVEIAEGIINLQAEYGVDLNNDNQISSTEWSSAAPGDWSKVRAVRVAILARSQQYEKQTVTPTAPSWAGGAFTMTNVDGTADTNPASSNNWRRYRYRVYQMEMPLRNVIWGQS